MRPCYRLVGCLLITLIVVAPASAQEQPEAASDAARFFPRQGFLLSGYGGAGYRALFTDEGTPNDFSAIFAPIMLFQISDRFLFEGELEFELEEGVTATDLEYAQVDVALTNNLTLVAGKFLLPFNVFSERLHPSWINRLISGPALYGGHGSLAPTDPILPVLADVGVQLRGAYDLGDFRTLTAEIFVTQGPTLAEEGHAEEPAPAGPASKTSAVAGGGAEPGDLAFGGDFADNNEDKMVGGRVGFGIAPYFEINVSGMTGAYDRAGDLRFSALGLHLEGRHKSFTIHGEFMQTWQDRAAEDVHNEGSITPSLPAKTRSQALAATLNEAPSETLVRRGYWVQSGYRWGKWQPLVRWTQFFASDLDGETAVEAGRQLALGLDYWFEPTLVLKVEYLINDEEHSVDNNRLALQLAFGF
ncbi:MAG: hypothetical protein KatS3mg050_4767 [Litorilinea sp.]|nr:MAG: hypothetical protein KatS3mg050_4767 [Litorilinea sp.]